jgi:hypothetical protein
MKTLVLFSGGMDSTVLLEFDWSQFHRSTDGEPPLLKTIELEVPTEVFKQLLAKLTAEGHDVGTLSLNGFDPTVYE